MGEEKPDCHQNQTDWSFGHADLSKSFIKIRS